METSLRPRRGAIVRTLLACRRLWPPLALRACLTALLGGSRPSTSTLFSCRVGLIFAKEKIRSATVCGEGVTRAGTEVTRLCGDGRRRSCS